MSRPFRHFVKLIKSDQTRTKWSVIQPGNDSGQKTFLCVEKIIKAWLHRKSDNVDEVTSVCPGLTGRPLPAGVPGTGLTSWAAAADIQHVNQ